MYFIIHIDSSPVNSGVRWLRLNEGNMKPKVNSLWLALFAWAACLVLFAGSVFAGSVYQKRRWPDAEGLYYLDGGLDSEDNIALVISLDRRPIPPKDNDPSAPTLPSLHVIGVRFKLRSFSLSRRQLTFHTVSVGSVSYSFNGYVGREDVDIIKDVPFLKGALVKRVRGRVVERRRARFVHAVIL
jgi:hypothetical protein